MKGCQDGFIILYKSLPLKLHGFSMTSHKHLKLFLGGISLDMKWVWKRFELEQFNNGKVLAGASNWRNDSKGPLLLMQNDRDYWWRHIMCTHLSLSTWTHLMSIHDSFCMHNWNKKSVDIGFVKAFISINKRQPHNEPITDQKSKLDLLKTSLKKL